MSEDILSVASRLSNEELLKQIQFFAQREREAGAVLIAHLAVLDERRLYLAEGCSSLFTYCTRVLHFSEHAAYLRMEAARAARRYPVILEMLADGSVNLTAVGLLAPELTPANHRNLLKAARHKSKEQVREILAQLRPQPPVASKMRKLPLTSTSPPSKLDGAKAAELAPTVQASIAQSPPRPEVVPLAPRRYKVQFTASAETFEKLRQAQDLMRHQIPDGDLGKIIDRAMTLLLKEVIRQKCAGTDRPGESRGTNDLSRHIPAEVKRKVWARDQGRCAFVAHSGRRCAERAFLEFHHVVPYAAGGKASMDNIQLRCRAHNAYEADLFFGSPASDSG